jgi:hypothetical protein
VELMTLDEFVAEVCERLRADMQSIRDPEGDVHPALFYSFDGESIRRFKIPTSWFDGRAAKKVMAKAIEQATTMSRPRMIGFESTAWTIEVSEAERVDAAGQPTTSIKDVPGRREVVQVIALDRTEHRYASSEVTRDGRNPPTYGEWEIITPDTMEGALWEPLRRGMQG